MEKNTRGHISGPCCPRVPKGRAAPRVKPEEELMLYHDALRGFSKKALVTTENLCFMENFF